MMPFAFYLRVDRGGPSGSASNSPKVLTINQMQAFEEGAYYAWFYEGSQWLTYVGGVAMLAIILAGVMFPLWPPIMRLGVWYLSMVVLALIGLFFVIAIIRLIFYIITIIVASPGIWIFPKLFADVGFVSTKRAACKVFQSLILHRSSRLSLSGSGTNPRRRRARKRMASRSRVKRRLS